MGIRLYKTDGIRPIGERASAGWLLKWRVKQNGVDIWLKTPGYMVFWGGESYAECLVSAIAKDLGIKNCVEYRPCVVEYKGERILSCESDHFIPEGYELFTYQRVLKLYKLDDFSYSGKENSKKFKDDIQRILGIDVSQQLSDLITLDSVVLNYDRNFWNFGVLVRKQDRKVIPAPIFDTGNSLDLPFFYDGEFIEESLHTDGRLAAPFSESFDSQYEIFSLNPIHSDISSINFKKMMKWFYDNASDRSNRVGVVNPIPVSSLERASSIVEKRIHHLRKLKVHSND